MCEPANLWLERLDRRLHHRAPHVERRGRWGDFFVAEGLPAKPMALSFAALKDEREHEYFGRMDIPAAAWDPDARLQAQDTDSIAAEVMYPTYAMYLGSMPSHELQLASARAYNDWMSEFCRCHPRRLWGIGIVPVYDAEVAAREIERVSRLDLRGIMIPAEAPLRMSYADRRFDRLWATAQDHALPVSLHGFTSGRPLAGSNAARWLVQRVPRLVDRLRRLRPPDSPLTARPRGGGPTLSWAAGYVGAPYRIQTTFCEMILGGVFTRFPQLRLVSVENDIGWIAHFLERLDSVYETHRAWMRLPQLPMTPSEIFREHVFATFMTERAGLATRHLVGCHRLLWASDFPHASSTWPRSAAVVEADFAGIASDERQQMVAGNARHLYGVEDDLGTSRP